ncbi:MULTISPECIES: carboxymuconolactone decarboxylase family protein [Bacillaceae]|uniref:carboxymuconolactone decarboxylase family protein n=1 Tax=Bacillaceae TaxID=186817 RepID=UPI002A183472|nr:carboxymuconolactone decarboxylase family protein [Cytobacillus sp. IB215316]MDX8360736.1 carboxymuconolactone decarboxylase family protein [Cytobacillus sp. IB215316]
MKTRFIMGDVDPEAYKVMFGLEGYVSHSSIDKKMLELIKIRASQINGCAFCIDMHTRDARKNGESEERIYALNAWRETDFYTDKERAVLALTESITLVSEKHVPDAVYDGVKNLYSEKEISELIMSIITINAWNRIAIATRMMPMKNEQ